jgi:lysyl-tRNA synthetase class 2
VPERLTVAAAFERHAGIDLMPVLCDRAGFAAAATAAGIRIAEDDSWSDIFSRVLVERVEPRLGNGRATILTEYPRDEAALAREKPGDPRVAERFEVFMCGVELANGFGELNDPVEQRARLDAEMAKKLRLYGERYPIDEDFLAALSRMPPACGCALGFDRLVMLATGASQIDQVIWTPLG